jgi:hypothetical protein
MTACQWVALSVAMMVELVVTLTDWMVVLMDAWLAVP